MNFLVFLGSSIYFLVPFWVNQPNCSYPLLILSVFSLSLFLTQSLSDCRYMSLLTALGEFFCCLTRNGFWASSSCFFFVIVCVWIWRSQTVVLSVSVYVRIPLYFFWGEVTFFWYGHLKLCCLFLWCKQSVIPRRPNVFSGRRGKWVGSAFIACKQRPAGRWHRL